MADLVTVDGNLALIDSYYAIFIDKGVPFVRPLAGKAFLIHWKEADIVIPWPEGLTPKEAILKWAKEQP